MTKPKSNKPNVKKVVDKIAKALAYAVLILTSSYGIRMMLSNIQENIALAITVLFSLALVYIVFNK
jgi:hypothetical protein